MTTHLTFVHALSPLHAGTGQGSGILDLPIAREKATLLPFLPGSSLKGTLRNNCDDAETCAAIFGPDMSQSPDNDSYASAVQISDQRLLLFPVRSLAGTFSWVTSPYILRRLVRDLKAVNRAIPTCPIPETLSLDTCIVNPNSTLIVEPRAQEKFIYLEDLDLKVTSAGPDPKAIPAGNAEETNWGSWIGKQIFPGDPVWQDMLHKRFCIIHDDIFNFLVETATEVITRIRLQNDTKTVQGGALWYEEALPTETVLSGLIQITGSKNTSNGVSQFNEEKVLKTIQEQIKQAHQLGGKATVGRGLCQIHISNLKPTTK